MRPGARVCSLVLLITPCLSARVMAQDPINEVKPSCSSNSPVVRTAVGGTIGAWLGFVAAKIKMSDWNDASRGSAANRTRNRATIAGALVGAALTNVLFRSHACGAEVPQVAEATAPKPNARRPITAEEIQRAGVNTNVYDLINTLRRNWLNVRGVDTFSEAPRRVTVDGQDVTIPGEPQLIVYLDNTRLGTISQLRDLPVPGIVGVRYYDGPEATFKWGAGHSHGAIQVLTVVEPSSQEQR